MFSKAHLTSHSRMSGSRWVITPWLWKKDCEVSQSCLTLCDPMDCSLPGSSVHGILQARVLEWVAISFSRGSSQPRDWTRVSHIEGRCFNLWATREARLSGFWRSFLYSSYVYSCYLLISSTSVRSIPFLSYIYFPLIIAKSWHLENFHCFEAEDGNVSCKGPDGK